MKNPFLPLRSLLTFMELVGMNCYFDGMAGAGYVSIIDEGAIQPELPQIVTLFVTAGGGTLVTHLGAYWGLQTAKHKNALVAPSPLELRPLQAYAA